MSKPIPSRALERPPAGELGGVRSSRVTFHSYESPAPPSKVDCDALLRTRLSCAAETDAEFWSFRRDAKRTNGHGCFQYPAMTVPQLQRFLIQSVRSVAPNLRRVLDPFVGSGTTMIECMMEGLDFVGYDINPLAVLLCRSKIAGTTSDALSAVPEEIRARITSDSSESIDVSFDNLNKWFRHDVAVALSKVRRAIQSQPQVEVRQVCWVAFAETIRVSSNSRTSTFKLHTRPSAEIKGRVLDPIDTFLTILRNNSTEIASQRTLLEAEGHSLGRQHARSIDVRLRDITQPTETPEPIFDMVITSPPYGDNATTVPYGQHSYLPLQWIDPKDLDEAFDGSYLRSTHEIDRRSLGGVRRGALLEVREVREKSPSLDLVLCGLETFPRDRKTRVAAFFRDFDLSLNEISASVREGGYLVWTVGNRCVGGQRVCFDDILIELLASRHVSEVARVTREIPSKRMARKNSVSPTMAKETIIVFRKGV